MQKPSHLTSTARYHSIAFSPTCAVQSPAAGIGTSTLNQGTFCRTSSAGVELSGLKIVQVSQRRSSDSAIGSYEQGSKQSTGSRS